MSITPFTHNSNQLTGRKQFDEEYPVASASRTQIAVNQNK